MSHAESVPNHPPQLDAGGKGAKNAAGPIAESVLTAEGVVRLVLERNPTLDQMAAAAAAAAARYPQVTSLDDPVIGVTSAPGSIGSSNADFANRVEVTQKIPYPGKREGRGRAAKAEASAAERDVDDARVQLVDAARAAFADYYLAVKAAGVARENLALLREFHRNAETRYRTGVAPQQDVLQADVEMVKVEERLINLRRAKAVAVARLNALMHLPSANPLPPPGDLAATDPLPTADDLRARALANRPDLQALANRLTADEATIAVANREYKPDVELLAAYDGFWQGPGGRPLQWQVGARVNLPIRLTRRDGALAEAQARAAQRRAEYVRLTDQIGLQVQEAYEQAKESDDVTKLYDTKLLPVAESNVREAQSAYVNGKVPFLSLVEAQRNLFGVKDRSYEVRAEAYKRRATLERVAGGSTVPAAR